MKTKDYIAAAGRLTELSGIFRKERATRILNKSGINPADPDYETLLYFLSGMPGVTSIKKQGWGKYDVHVITPPPVERITWTSYIDPQLLTNI